MSFTGWLARDSLERSLRELCLLQHDESLISCIELSDWRRGGAESFIAEAEILCSSSEGDRRRRFVAKAVLPPFGWAVVDYLTEMMGRRTMLAEAGVPVVQQYAVREGVLFQAHLPYSVSDLYRSGNWAEPMMAQAHDIERKVRALGFHPLNVLADLRSDGEKLYYVDFGADLGGPSSAP